MTQLMPRLTSALMSPCVATTRLSFTATLTPQPTPQNRQGALDHLSSVRDASVTTFAAPAMAGSPAATAVALPAVCRMKSLLVMLMRPNSCCIRDDAGSACW